MPVNVNSTISIFLTADGEEGDGSDAKATSTAADTDKGLDTDIPDTTDQRADAGEVTVSSSNSPCKSIAPKHKWSTNQNRVRTRAATAATTILEQPSDSIDSHDVPCEEGDDSQLATEGDDEDSLLGANKIAQPVKDEKINHDRTCEYCGAVRKSPADLERHLRKHTGERPFICEVNNTLICLHFSGCYIKIRVNRPDKIL